MGAAEESKTDAQHPMCIVLLALVYEGSFSNLLACTLKIFSVTNINPKAYNQVIVCLKSYESRKSQLVLNRNQRWPK